MAKLNTYKGTILTAQVLRALPWVVGAGRTDDVRSGTRAPLRALPAPPAADGTQPPSQPKEAAFPEVMSPLRGSPHPVTRGYTGLSKGLAHSPQFGTTLRGIPSPAPRGIS